MSRRISLWAKEHPLIVYFVLAYAISWAIVAPLVASAQGFIVVPVPFALHYLNDYAPLLAALVTAEIANGTEGLRDLLRRVIRWRVGLGWVLVAAFSPLVVWGIAIGTVVFGVGDPPPDFSSLGTLSYLPYLGWAGLVFWILAAGIGEESGWRGYALPKLQGHMSALSATLIVTLFWVGWLLPRFFYYGAYMELGFSVLPLAAHGFLALAIVLTWLYNSTRESILIGCFISRWLQFLGRLWWRWRAYQFYHRRIVHNMGCGTGGRVRAGQPFVQLSYKGKHTL